MTHPQSDGDRKYRIARDALLAICDGKWDAASSALARDPELVMSDAVCLNLVGVVCQARRQWRKARRYYGKSMRVDRNYAPAEQNMRRLYELDTFGSTSMPVALADQATVAAIRDLASRHRDERDETLARISVWMRPSEAMDAVTPSFDWIGYAWAVGTVIAATAIGWPFVHGRFHLADSNVLMLYLLSVLWVATRYSRGAAVVASVLGVALFDFCFVKPYYTFNVADQQYVVIFAAMLVTALVISTTTHRMRHQTEVARQVWERVEAEFLRNTLLSGVSHELRTPLAAITGAASSLLETGKSLSPETQTDLLQTICSESDRMERLITNLLDMTRMEAGGLVVKKEWLPLQEVIGSALRRMEPRLEGRQVKIDIADDQALVQMDSVLIEQVLANLIDNVIEYTPPQTPIEITATSDGRETSVEVADRGPGLPRGTEKRVFEKFFRARPNESRRGIGLGLAIVRGIVELHGGKVSAANRDGGGAVFRFTLPITGPAPAMDSSA